MKKARIHTRIITHCVGEYKACAYIELLDTGKIVSLEEFYLHKPLNNVRLSIVSKARIWMRENGYEEFIQEPQQLRSSSKINYDSSVIRLPVCVTIAKDKEAVV